MKNSTLFNIQKFSLHDGPGIRTTLFFKGCPLRCKWCHNPEGLSSKIEILYNKDKCTLCGECIKRCPKSAISLINKRIETDVAKCCFCDECTHYCVNGAREIAGKEYSIEELVKIILKDKIFYEESNGGVTLSGGEPVMQTEFVEELLKRLKQENIHTAVDTSGIMPFECYERIYKYTDLFLYDIKLIDDEKHKKFTGLSNAIILDNLKRLSKIHSNINIRLPIIEGVNADDEHINGVINLIDDLGIKNVNLLPYHDISRHKYKKLDMEYDGLEMNVPSSEKMEEFKTRMENAGYNAKIGG